jgi:hypothetical protein
MRARFYSSFREHDALATASIAGALLLAIVATPLTAHADCIVLPGITLPQNPPQGAAAPGRESEISRPMSETDLTSLIQALEPVPLKEGTGVGIRAAVEGKSALSPDRFTVVMADAVSLLAVLHARETLEAIGRAGLPPANRKTLEGDLRRIITCGESRFASRGGPAAMKSSLDLVQKHRPELETLVFSKLQPVRKEGVR